MVRKKTALVNRSARSYTGIIMAHRSGPTPTRQPVVNFLPLDTYRAVLANSPGAKIFRQAWVKIAGRRTEALHNGELSCAFFVSVILKMFGFIRESHLTVAGAVADLKRSGWRQILRPRVGCVIRWKAIKFADGENHEHLGFYLGKQWAISNSYTHRVPRRHHWTFGQRHGRPVRPVAALYWHPKLG